MAEHYTYKLKIDEDFKRLIPPLSSEELFQLEQNIIRDGCREPLCVWKHTILDGHNRYEICSRLEIPFHIHRMNFKSREEATSWICNNQLGRRNITEETRRYLIGKRYEMEKLLGAHNAAGTNQHSRKEVRDKMYPEPHFDENSSRTRERLGEEYNISPTSVRKYGKYTKALDTLSEILPEFVPKVLSGQTKISQENVIELSQLPQQEVLRVANRISNDSNNSIAYSDARTVLSKRARSRKRKLPMPTVTVKDMPAYDPDAEISSLTLTIPSWISSIERTHTLANLNKTSSKARFKLEKQLLELKDTIIIMLVILKEEV